jgi:hypothetical protein
VLQQTADETGIPQVNIPPVQRGLVWDVSQIELFWDSLLRGFPFGALVFVPLRSDPNRFDLFDGQQRCDAIYWGFQPDFEEDLRQNDKIRQILWLDLLPGDRLKNSTRRFLVRLTTRAHPWGFWRSDDAAAISLRDRREFFGIMEAIRTKHCNADKKHGDFEAGWRPSLTECVPYDAGFPVPMPLLFQAIDKQTQKIDWNKVAEHRLVQLAEDWKNTKLEAVLTNSQYKANIEAIERALFNAMNTPVVAVHLAPDVSDGVDGFEDLFIRLNRNGTPLSEEELAYSMIKVGWPEIENTMDAIVEAQKQHASEARLIRMGMRAALTTHEATKLEPAPSPSLIRAIFASAEPNSAETKENLQKRGDLQKFFKLKEVSEGKKTASVIEALEWIDKQLCFNEQDRNFGIPPYLRSAIAWRSPEVFSWLMLLAGRYEYEAIDDELAKVILAFALCLHWFAEDKERAVSRLIELSHNRGDLSMVKLNDFDKDDRRLILWPILTQEELVEAIQIVRVAQTGNELFLKEWKSSIWQGVVTLREPDQRASLPEKIEQVWGKRPGGIERSWEDVGNLVERIHHQTEFLVYAQRKYISKVFKKFDPSDQRLWKGHNRPWDYDHILATNRLDGRTGSAGPYHSICKLWQGTIGNLVAIDLVHNRSEGDNSPATKLHAYKQLVTEYEWDPFLRLDGLDQTGDGLPNLDDFDLDIAKTADYGASVRFVLASQRRMVELYRHWFDELDVKRLIGPTA